MSSKYPRDWEVQTLQDVSDIRGGKRLPRGNSLVSENTGYPYIRVSDMNEVGIDLANIQFVPVGIAPLIRQYRIFKDDLYVSVAGTVGLVGEVPLELDGANLTENADRITNIKVDRTFLLNVLRSEIVQQQIKEATTLNAQPKLALHRLRNLEIPLPPLAEQRKIAAILGTWDEAIALVQQLIAALQTRKKGLMHRLLTGQVRFKEFEGSQWEEVRLSTLGRCIRGVSYSPPTDLKPSDEPDTVRLLRANNISGGRINIESLQFVVKERCRSEQLLLDGDLAICIASGSKELVGKTAAYETFDQYAYTVGAFCAIYRPYDAEESGFLRLLFQSEQYRKELEVLSAGSSINNLRPNDIENMYFFIPQLSSERMQIAKIIGLMDQQIDGLVTFGQQLRQQKRGLMQRLLTGQIRVRVDDGHEPHRPPPAPSQMPLPLRPHPLAQPEQHPAPPPNP